MGGKKVLVLDVDETLLNVEPLFFLEKFKKNYEEYKGILILDRYYMSPRPNLKPFLQKAKEHFELVAFSVVGREFTKQKLEKLGILSFFSQVYGKESLVDGKKDMNIIAKDFSKDVEDVIIIDDSPNGVMGQNNVIHIPPWFIGSSKEDDELVKVFDKLLKLNVVE